MIILLSLIFSLAHAQSNWLCSQDSSQMQGNQFYACGVGQSPWEGVAREHAFNRAKREFVELCNLSTDCWKKHRSVDPGRTTCDKTPTGGYKCYRLIIFILD